jgi:hypothetical protein
MSRTLVSLLVLLLPLGAARAQLREPTCPTFVSMSDAQREFITVGMIAGFEVATRFTQETAMNRAADPELGKGAQLASDRLSRLMLNLRGRSPRDIAARIRQDCVQGKYLASTANQVFLDVMIEATPGRGRPEPAKPTTAP